MTDLHIKVVGYGLKYVILRKQLPSKVCYWLSKQLQIQIIMAWSSFFRKWVAHTQKMGKINESAIEADGTYETGSQQDAHPTRMCQRGGTPASNDILARTRAVIGRRARNQCATPS